MYRLKAKAFPLVGVALSLAFSLSTAAAQQTHGHDEANMIRIHESWARASAGVARNGAAFMQIENAGDSSDRLLSASTAVAAKAELHTHVHDGGVMRMRPVDAVDVTPGTTVVMKPGGFHVMLLDLEQPLEKGASFDLTLTFEKAGRITVPVSVLAPGAMGPKGGASDGQHGGMSGHKQH